MDILYKGKSEEKTAVRLPHDAMQYEERIPKLKNGPLVAFYPGGIITTKRNSTEILPMKIRLSCWILAEFSWIPMYI